MPPNILIILADDIGVDCLRINKATRQVTAHVTGKDIAGPVRLPAFERLLKAGVHFEHAWAHPVCTPTRASLWTGQNPWKTTLGYPTGGGDNLPATTVTGTNIVSLATALKPAGSTYKCAMFGKWDLGAAKNPVQWGWDMFAGIYAGGLRPVGVNEYQCAKPNRLNYTDLIGTGGNPPSAAKAELGKTMGRRLVDDYKYYPEFIAKNPDLRFFAWHKDTVFPDGTAKVAQPPTERKFLYATEDEMEDAKQWITLQKGKNPWCVALTLISPHDPLHVPAPGSHDPTIFTDPSNPTIQEMVVATLQATDYYLGKFLDSIDDQLAQTVIIFAGDNGTQDNDPDTTENIDNILLDDKGSRAVGGVQVPMIVADGGLMKGLAPIYLTGAPRTVQGPVHVMDVYRTALSIAGLSTNAPIDSISMAPLLNGSAGTPRAMSFSQEFDDKFPPEADGVTRLCAGYNASIFDGKYKLTCFALLGGSGRNTFFVNEQGAKVVNPVVSYEFSTVDPDPNIIGSFIDTKIPAIIKRGNAFEVRDGTYEAKILALYAGLSNERLDENNTQFPPINGAPLVADWRMAEGSGTQLVDRSGHNYNGTVAGATWVPDGVKAAQVLAFNGTTGIVVGTAPSLSGKTAFTLAGWVKTSGALGNGHIIQQANPGGFAYQLAVLPDGSVLFSVFGDGVQQFEITSVTKVNNGQWHHVSAVRDGNNGYIYIDGVLAPAAQGAGNAVNLNGALPVAIGVDRAFGFSIYDGAMFDLRIYRIALSAIQIALDLALPLRGYWPLDESSGTSVFSKVYPNPKSAIIGKANWSDAPRGLLFDAASSNEIKLGASASLAGKVPFTISAWVRMTAGATTGGVIIQQRDPADFDGEYQILVKADGTVQFWVFGDGQTQFQFSSAAAVNNGQWHHVVAIREGDNGYIYIDGVLSAQASGPAVNLRNTITAGIGADIRDNITFFTGRIREVRIYEAALSLPLITALAATPPT